MRKSTEHFLGHLFGCTPENSTYSASSQTADCHCFDLVPPGGHSCECEEKHKLFSACSVTSSPYVTFD